MRFKATAITATNYGTGIVLNIGIPITYGKQVDAITQSFKAGNEYDLSPYKAKRSLKANALLWHYADELAKVLKTTKEHIYKVAIYNVGRHEILETKDKIDKNGNIERTKEEIAEDFCKRWCMNGLGWFAYQDKVRPEVIYMYYGSSVYNSAEMSRTIDFLQDECRRQGIETKPKEEVDAMLKEWEKEHG